MCNECEIGPSGYNDSYASRILINSCFGVWHCLSGPAIVYREGLEEWYINGEYVRAIELEDFKQTKQYRAWKIKAFT